MLKLKGQYQEKSITSEGTQSYACQIHNPPYFKTLRFALCFWLQRSFANSCSNHDHFATARHRSEFFRGVSDHQGLNIEIESADPALSGLIGFYERTRASQSAGALRPPVGGTLPC